MTGRESNQRNRGQSNYASQGSYGDQGYGRSNDQWGGSQGYRADQDSRSARSMNEWEGSYGGGGGSGMNQWGGSQGYRSGQSYGGQDYGSQNSSQNYRGQESGGSQGRYSGVGPRGYQRSDDRIKEDISDRLTWHSDVDASNIDVKVEKGNVTLSGSVNDRWTKRTAEDIAESIQGVQDVQNQIQVRRQNESQSGSMQGENQGSWSQSGSQSGSSQAGASGQSSTSSTSNRKNAQAQQSST